MLDRSHSSLGSEINWRSELTISASTSHCGNLLHFSVEILCCEVSHSRMYMCICLVCASEPVVYLLDLDSAQIALRQVWLTGFIVASID